MKLAIKNQGLNISYPDEEEIREAVKACCGRCCHACESPVEYAWRKRRVDLGNLVEDAIENRLTEKERNVIKEIYFDEMTVSEIAEKDGVSKAAVSSLQTRAKEKLKDSLEYVVMYQYDMPEDCNADLAITDAITISAAGHKITGSPGEKLKNLRIRKGLSISKVSNVTKIKEDKLKRIEECEISPDLRDLFCLCRIYHVTFEELMKDDV